jgi:hypothetical protein
VVAGKKGNEMMASMFFGAFTYTNIGFMRFSNA